MKLSLRNAVLILLTGMLLLAVGSFLRSDQIQLSNPIILTALAIEFVGTIWLVLSLNQRRKRNKI
ncbi:hypothetical protein [Dyadobacter fanqingshengii]|uniref:Uncharacterized protein n=1 Tax=Dyadobacter fanqingshengii TaxID=2906443 RepID=A0A9X1P5Y6_9BACT|nr:hypothetical protein [Dyadobacter fanqingshengii]MCF0038545.1 hypothetical protein [Dyadobacter fanqingshengii]MCF2503927.1 hypothetical protein [Dyadobacter fanqingshengii]USJ34622.1 hypothetical protein NFI81_18130 [Dyadobacter fanqingshengii]